MKKLFLLLLFLIPCVSLTAQKLGVTLDGGLQYPFMSNQEVSRDLEVRVSSSSGYTSRVIQYTVTNRFEEKPGGFASAQGYYNISDRWKIQYGLGLNLLRFKSYVERSYPEGISSALEGDLTHTWYNAGTTVSTRSYDYVRNDNGEIEYYSDGYPKYNSEELTFDLYSNSNAGETLFLYLEQQIGVGYLLNNRIGIEANLMISHRLYSITNDPEIKRLELHPEYPAHYTKAVLVTSRDTSGDTVTGTVIGCQLAATYALNPNFSVKLAFQQSLTNIFDTGNLPVSSSTAEKARPLMARISLQYSLKRW